jgi:O-antigen ligase
MQPSAVFDKISTVPSLLTLRKRSELLLFMVMFVSTLATAPLLIVGGMTVGFGLTIGILLALVIAVLVVRWPVIGMMVIAGCAVLIEETPLKLANIFTDHLYIYYWPPSLEGLIERPIGFFFLFVLFVVICHRLAKRKTFLAGGPLIVPFVLFLLCVAWGIIHGLTSGGDLKIVVVEVRPFWYLFESYLLAYNVITRKEHIKAFFWIIILAAGIKGLQGCYLVFVVLHGSLAGHDEIMAHEDSFFFAALLLLIVLFSLHYRYRAQLWAALIELPVVVIALVANQRRADYVALLLGLAIAWLLIFWVKPKARKRLVIALIMTVVVGGAYVVAFANSSGTFGSPAHSIIAVFDPGKDDARDIASNLYRQIENYDLEYTTKQSPIYGYGFGKQFLTPVPLTDISSDDEYYLFIPHNNIYWIWMRLGAIGYLVFWYLIAMLVIRGCLIVRRLRDPYLQMVGIYVIAVTFIEITVAFADYQLFFYRNVIYFGLLTGMLMKLPALDQYESKEVVVDEHSSGFTESAVTNVGS